jgi:hypothetical protein
MDIIEKNIQYRYLNIAFKLFIVVFILLFIIFYFKFDIFKIKLFKSSNHNDNQYVFEEYNINRNIVNAISNSNYNDKILSDFFIKTSFNCCNIGYGNANIERLKTIISQGFRCFDFKLIYKNNTIHIENQPKNETFYNALEIIDRYSFSNTFCNNNDDPVIINIRLNDTNKNNTKLIYKKLRDMFKTLGSKHILNSSYSLLENIKDKENYNNILSAPLNKINGKIIVMCNYNYNIIEDDTIDNKHELLQYVHFNTYIVNESNELDNIDIPNIINNTYYNNLIVSMSLHNTMKGEEIININKNVPSMIIPDSFNNISAIENPSSLFNVFGYTFRALEFSSIGDFKSEISDSNIKSYIDDFNTANSAFILKPLNIRR